MLLTNKETGESKEVDCKVDKDECNRPETTLEGLSSLKPVFDPENGTVTAGNSSQLSDGASVTLVMSEDKAKELGLKPIAYFRGFTTMGCELDGGSISNGHPFGMTGSRQVGHLTRQLESLDKQFGVVTMCIGGGMGASGLFERYPS